ncbi:MAG: hypothetical protein WBA28_06455 [Microbacteriaceae bacterium]
MAESDQSLPLGTSREFWKNRRVLILGAGDTAFSAADTLAELQAELLVVALSANPDLLPLFQVIGADPRLGLSEDEMLEAALEFNPEFIIASPSFSPEHPVLTHFVSHADTEVLSEAELAWRLRAVFSEHPAEWITLSGEHARRVAELAENMLSTAGIAAIRLGFGSAPVLDGIRNPEKFDYFLIVLSPEQLHFQHRVQPLMSLFLSPDVQPSWHEDAAARLVDQGKIFSNTQKFALYNRSDELAEILLREADVIDGCRAIGFWLASPGPGDLGVVEELVVDRAYLEDRRNSALEISTLDELQRAGFEGQEQFEIFLAAAALVRGLGVTPEEITLFLSQRSAF